MQAPRIGVTGMWSNQIHGLRFDGTAVASAVLRSVVRAGGEPLTLFAEGPSPAAERLRGLDGLLIPGGFDLDPARYGQAPLPTTVTADFAAQDQFEADLLSAAIAAGVPVLAICRGFQLLNVEHGGTMVQDLPADSVHRNSVHPVELAPDSALAGALGVTELPVSSYHHQAVDAVGTGLRVVGRAADGIVEALEHERAELLAVQWHPEDTAATDPTQQALFDWLVERAAARAARTERSAA
ncbi:gamma-glutamyl-gamma-aminobutyrate hydrolase family protein [Leucobacter chromiireducens]|uniref:Gamma-glutamyl-gamma-aminobutyrate hydrolase family protein n=1 Tax=Leucobacter chromiireducens subsp. solipictus TaxID=398235 RepID=A0ABS1SCQ9_9MICO|nr:gamma-glutamyl-gamma-aminobutyrate hydrolase family protein [Leucobacter chromiireducens]MBL3678326.1 gamma-glutamyl-gamma-aminobutyrate hydrolase family protein [Leucobacter chromiireducens subsp. solipictus]